MVIDNCKKIDFLNFVEVSENKYIVRWAKEDRIERVGAVNEETGKWEFTGEVRETDWCTFEYEEFSKKPTMADLKKLFAKSQRLPKASDLRALCEPLGMTEEQMLPYAKEYLAKAVAKYDKSSEVEDFTVGGVHLWLNSEMRAKVRENLETAQQKGEENVTLRYNGMAFPMTVAMGWQLYYAVLDYARATWDVTEIHNASIPSLETVDAVCEYEEYFPTAYPEKPAF